MFSRLTLHCEPHHQSSDRQRMCRPLPSERCASRSCSYRLQCQRCCTRCCGMNAPKHRHESTISAELLWSVRLLGCLQRNPNEEGLRRRKGCSGFHSPLAECSTLGQPDEKIAGILAGALQACRDNAKKIRCVHEANSRDRCHEGPLLVAASEVACSLQSVQGYVAKRPHIDPCHARGRYTTRGSAEARCLALHSLKPI